MGRTVELLAPARDLETGIAAIDSGADAVYIGAPRFGARAKAGNSLEDLAALAAHAHTYWARVYVTVNTLLHDDELPHAVDLIHRLYDIGVDAVIIQDMGLLEAELPPIPLIASTQTHNHTPERVAFLEAVGIRRVILARELSLDEIRAIRAATTVELETFVHGALCVSYSGQCYMSYAIGGRSGNRGECAQPCRRRYTLVDRDGKVLAEHLHLLSLRDLNLAHELGALLDAGITSFKIEGRLKDAAYVKNVVSWYRQQLDRALVARNLVRSSSGHSHVDFEPDVDKTFNRGYTSYFLHGNKRSGEPPGAIESPKMVGERVGTVHTVDGDQVTIATDLALHSGDGLTWFDPQRELTGTLVNAVEPRGNRVQVTVEDTRDLRPGVTIYRNRDHAFLRQVEQSRPVRQMMVQFRLEAMPDGFRLQVTDEDGNVAASTLTTEKALAHKPAQAEATAHRQLEKTGDTPFTAVEVDLAWGSPYFVPVSMLNELRRDALANLLEARAANRPRMPGGVVRNEVPYPETRLDHRGNVLNRQAEAFYRRHGVTEIEPAAESGVDMEGRVVMRTRYCVQHQLGLCDGAGIRADVRQPLLLIDADGHRYRLRFRCADCEMEVVY
ncbi:MAG TPA: U32 family peptidase [Anaerolineae bacterium]|nr:U32 family peptidase [Anaerolineae bacterium]